MLAFLISSLPLPGFSRQGTIALFSQSFPVPPRPGPSPWLLVNALVILAFFALAFVVYRRDERRRARALAAIGTEMGLRFQRRGIVGPQAAKLPLFKFHPKAHAKNILSGTLNSSDVLIFDYFCPTFGQDPPRSEPIQQTVAAFRFANVVLPLFLLQTRTFLDKVPECIRRLLGERYREVTLDSSPDFSRRFLLRAKDVSAVRNLFTPEAARLLDIIPETDWLAEASGEWLLAYRQSVLLEPRLELYREFISRVSRIASLVAHGKPGADIKLSSIQPSPFL